jgi:hypothetical protein
MPTNEAESVLAQDLAGAIDELQGALTRASDAATRIKTLVPRITAVHAMLDEIEAVLHAGRQDIGARTLPESFTRPTLVVPGVAATPAPIAEPPTATDDADRTIDENPELSAGTSELLCFRLEFQSSGGPLDLRAVDDAVGEHPAVRDVALLDYDGRNATLKVWIIATASPSDVEQSLNQRATEIFGDGSNVTIVALEDAA